MRALNAVAALAVPHLGFLTGVSELVRRLLEILSEFQPAGVEVQVRGTLIGRP